MGGGNSSATSAQGSTTTATATTSTLPKKVVQWGGKSYENNYDDTLNLWYALGYDYAYGRENYVTYGSRRWYLQEHGALWAYLEAEQSADRRARGL